MFTFSPLFLMIVFNDISVLSWNVRGANNPKTKRYLKELMNKYHPTFLVIMETHSAFENMKFFFEYHGYRKVAIVEAQGHSWCLDS
jgi:exonuclease III